LSREEIDNWRPQRTQPRCPLCQRPEVVRTPHPSRTVRVECEACGNFVVDANLAEYVWEKNGAKGRHALAYLPAYINRENQHDHIPVIRGNNWQRFAREGRRLGGRTSPEEDYPHGMRASFSFPKIKNVSRSSRA
jgi:hypothetical protein